jgi:uroporphyrinogen-III synthase
VWAVGAATQRALAIARIAATHPAGVRDGAELARRVVASCAVAGKRVLLPRAEEGRPEPAEILRAAGAIVDEVVAYRTVPTPTDDASLAPGLELVRTGRAAITALFAPSQVSALARLVELAAVQTRFIAIGETTAQALRAAGVTAVAVADTPTPEGIARAVRTV